MTIAGPGFTQATADGGAPMNVTATANYDLPGAPNSVTLRNPVTGHVMIVADDAAMQPFFVKKWIKRTAEATKIYPELIPLPARRSRR